MATRVARAPPSSPSWSWPESHTPVLHLRHREQHGIFDSYKYHFDDVFEKAAAPIWPPLEPIRDDETGTWKAAPWWDLESRKWNDDE